ncbi:MAG: hypothetical protein ACFE8L_06135 [Candidatus Hodarchaeota archaeon]
MNGEVIFLRLIDIGRSINLIELASIFPRIPDKRIIKTKDTPSYLDFPKPIIMELKQNISLNVDFVRDIKIIVKIYEDGVISLIARLNFMNLPLEELHNLKRIKFFTQHGEFNINQFLKFHSNKLYEQIKKYVDEENYTFGSLHYEKYTLFCLTDKVKDPNDFLAKNESYFVALLMGENPSLNLHQNQIIHTLENSFSFLKNDLVIFDFDRCLIIDPNCDYEDILLIIEIANYQLLELRVLDYLLDKRLSLAEGDIHKIYFKGRGIFNRLKKRVGNLIRLRHDLIFLLENIENVSKLIGDYYLSQIYSSLSNLFQLKQWSDSIRHRIETLGDIYNIAQTNINEKTLLYVEILLCFIFIMEFVLLILDFFK